MKQKNPDRIINTIKCITLQCLVTIFPRKFENKFGNGN